MRLRLNFTVAITTIHRVIGLRVKLQAPLAPPHTTPLVYAHVFVSIVVIFENFYFTI